MNTNIVISLDTRRAKKDGLYPLILRLGHRARTTSIPLKISLPQKDWNEEARKIKNSYVGTENVTRLNNSITKSKTEALDIILKLNEAGKLQQLSITELKDKIAKKISSTSFFDYTRQIIEGLISAKKIGNARCYQGVLDVLTSYVNDRSLSPKGAPCHKWIVNKMAIASASDKLESYERLYKDVKEYLGKKDLPGDDLVYLNQILEKLNKAHRTKTLKAYQDAVGFYLNEKDLAFDQVTYSFLVKFEGHHFSKGNKHNGLSVYMRTIRAVFNKAIKEGIIEKNSYPFENYQIKSVHTKKRALEWPHIAKIISLSLASTDPLFDPRSYFVASYMMYGMNFTDMADLLKTDITDGRIIYARNKTAKTYNIKITENLKKILDHYFRQNPKSKYVFPIITREAPLLREKDIQQKRKTYNKKLNELGRLCGIETNITSYVLRHSFATQALLQKIPIKAISEMLGHSSVKTTEIYLNSLPSDILDEYNASIIDRV